MIHRIYKQARWTDFQDNLNVQKQLNEPREEWSSHQV